MKLSQPQPPSDEEFEALKLGLNNFNQHYTGELLREKVSSFIKDNKDEVLGGIIGEIKWGWLYVEGLWVCESIRHDGWGAKLLNQIEHYATSKNINNFRLETTSFQALDFYQKNGYSIFGELPDMPPGHTSYFLKKQCK